jgi:two-component system, NarL family, sensor kinase
MSIHRISGKPVFWSRLVLDTMGRWLVFSGLLVFCTVALTAQNQSYTDSLKTALAESRTTSDSLTISRTLARYYLRYDLDQSTYFTTIFQSVASSVNDAYNLAVADHYLGLINRLQGNFRESLQYFESALEHFESDSATLQSCLGALFNIGVIHQTVGDYDKALEFFYRELELRTKLKIRNGYGSTLNSIGVTLKKMGNNERALEIYNEALASAIEAGDSVDLSNIYNNRGIVKELLGDLTGAMADYRTSLALDMIDGYASGIASSYESLSKNYLKLQMLDSAAYYAEMAYEMRKDLGQLKELVQSGHNLVQVALKQGKIDDAWMYAEMTTPRSTELGLPEVILQNYALLADIYRMKGEPLLETEALRAQLVWKDSLFNRQTIETARNLQVRYETLEKEQALAALQKENELNNLLISRQQKWQLLLIVALGLLLFLFILAVRFYQLKIEAHKLRASQERFIKEQNLKEVEAQNKILQMNAVLQGQEAERIRIAKDLHDGLGALLSTVKLHFASVQKEIKALAELNVYQKANDLLDNACTEVRRIAHNMMPDALAKLGLIQALEDLVEGLRLKGQKVLLETINLDQPLTDEIELMVYRIIQELTSNITRHADAGKVLVQLSLHDHQLYITVEDDGRGFDVDAVSEGIGLKNLRSRVAYLGGTIEMDSRKNIGTTTSIVIPLPVYSMAAS